MLDTGLGWGLELCAIQNKSSALCSEVGGGVEAKWSPVAQTTTNPGPSSRDQSGLTGLHQSDRQRKMPAGWPQEKEREEGRAGGTVAIIMPTHNVEWEPKKVAYL